jgi:hypothetical protein
MGKCHIELSATVNIGNFQSVKATVGFEEDYSVMTDSPLPNLTLEEARKQKFDELLEVCTDKLDDAVLTEVNRIQALTGKKHKNTTIED